MTKDISPTPWGDLEIYEYNGKYTARRQAIDSANSGKEIDIEELKSIAYNPWQYESVEDSTLHEVQTLPISVEPASSWASLAIYLTIRFLESSSKPLTIVDLIW